MGLAQYNLAPDGEVIQAHYTGTTALTTGCPLYWHFAADPNDATFDGFEVGSVVDIADASAVLNLTARFAGIVSDSSVGSTGGRVSLLRPKNGDIVVVSADVAVDVGDGLLPLASATRLDDSGAFALGDIFIVLSDEDSANNPFGTSAVDANTGLVHAVYTGNGGV